jgi:hypothetical protein
MERRVGLEITPASEADYSVVSNLARFYIDDVAVFGGALPYFYGFLRTSKRYRCSLLRARWPILLSACCSIF